MTMEALTKQTEIYTNVNGVSFMEIPADGQELHIRKVHSIRLGSKKRVWIISIHLKQIKRNLNMKIS